MTTQLKHLLIILGAIAVVLIVIILLFSGNSRFRRVLGVFLEEDNGSSGEVRRPMPAQRRAAESSEPAQKSKSEPTVVMATLIRKSDDRLRVIESTGQERIEDEYYELVFVTRKGQKLKIECSAEAYGKVPFNQQGSLTYKRNTLVKFKYYEDTVFN